MNDEHFPGTFALARRPGVYLRIIQPGAVIAGDTIEVDAAELPAVQIASLVEDDIAPEVLRQVLKDTRVPEGWRKAAARALQRR